MLLLLMDTPGVGARNVGSAAGMFFCVAEIGGFGGPLTLGVPADATGGFLSGVSFCAGLSLGIAACAVRLQARRR